jgi:uncharacterized protein
VRVALVSDTHLPRRRGWDLPPACVEAMRGADLVVHAGDLADMRALLEIRAVGPPVVAVHGNADDEEVRRALPSSAALDLPGLRLVVVHDGGPERGRLRSLRRRFPDAGAVVFGHSHIPFLDVDADGVLAVNPGSPTDRRRQPRHTMAELILRDGRPPEVRFLAVDDPAGPLPDELVRRPATAA